MVFSDPTTRVYQFIFYQEDSSDTNITQYFVMHELGLCAKLNSYVAHMFYAWSFSNNTSVPIYVKQEKHQIGTDVLLLNDHA